MKLIKLEESITESNDRDAQALRDELKEKGILLVNLMSAAGSGKTTLLSRIIKDLKDIKILGDHNVENVLAAAALSYYAGIDEEVIGSAVRAFPGVEHRIEFCGTRDGVDYYNDSKGTNVDAAVIALKALRNNIILIAGGDGKAQDFTDLAEHLNGAVTALVLLGRDAPLIEEAARKAGFTDIYTCGSMEECVRKSSELARSGDKVLLSPACASWDMYPNFEVRGRHFKQCVRDITG